MERLTIKSILGGWTIQVPRQKAVDRLAEYENTNLMPQEITTRKPACVFYCNRQCNLDGDWCPEGPGCPREIDAETAIKRLIQPSGGPYDKTYMAYQVFRGRGEHEKADKMA